MESDRHHKTRDRIARLLGISFLLLTVAFSAGIRIRTTLADPNFLTDRPDGLMRSDPGLLFYMLERIVENGGLPPADFRSDHRVEHPLSTDLPALDSVSQEFPIAWAYRLVGGGMPLHVFCLWFMGIFSSLTVVGVYFLAREVTGEVLWACLAAALFVVTEANYRTIGFLLMREDFALPFFALHLALLARATRVRTMSSMILCAMAATVALSSWHAMRFVVSLELLCIFVWYLATGENAFAIPFAWAGPALVAMLSLVIPLLSRTGFLLAPPLRMAAGLLTASLLAHRGKNRVAAGAAAIGVILALTLLQTTLSSTTGGAHYSHVWEMLIAKVRFLGELPADPNLLSFDARAMWQGPFVNLPLVVWNRFYGVGLFLFIPALALAVRDRYRGTNDVSSECLVALFTAIGLLCSWLVSRVMPIPGMLLPVCAVLLLRRVPVRHLGLGIMVGAIIWQAVAFGLVLRDYRISWYQPAFLTSSYRDVLSVLPSLVPEGEAVAADPVVSTSILAHTRRPIVLQPKWEEGEARVRLRDFISTFFHGTPDDLRHLLIDKYKCRYLLVDRYTLWEETRYIAGIPANQPWLAPGTAGSIFLGSDSGTLSSVPGYRLLYRTPRSITDEQNRPVDTMRLYELSLLPGERTSP